MGNVIRQLKAPETTSHNFEIVVLDYKVRINKSTGPLY